MGRKNEPLIEGPERKCRWETWPQARILNPKQMDTKFRADSAG